MSKKLDIRGLRGLGKYPLHLRATTKTKKVYGQDITLAMVETLVRKLYGPKCKNFCFRCPGCQAHHALESLESLLKEINLVTNSG